MIEREPLANGADPNVIAPSHMLCVILVVVERRDCSNEQHADDAPPIRELVVRGTVQHLCWGRAKRTSRDVEFDISPAFRVEVVKECSHVAGEAVDV